jgi:hypothetical protein
MSESEFPFPKVPETPDDTTPKPVEIEMPKDEYTPIPAISKWISFVTAIANSRCRLFHLRDLLNAMVNINNHIF